MKVLMPNGEVKEGTVRQLCVGIVARGIQLEPRDVQEMLNLLERNPDDLRVLLLQLFHRYEENRVGGRRENRNLPGTPFPFVAGPEAGRGPDGDGGTAL